MIVQKFGGSSIASPSKMMGVFNIVKNTKSNIVVLSAIARTTNKLYEIARLLISNHVSTAKNLIDELKLEYFEFVKALFSENENFKQKATEIVNKYFEILSSIYINKISEYDEKNIVAIGEYLSTGIFHILLQSSGLNSLLLNSLEIIRKDENEIPDYNYASEQFNIIFQQNPDVDVFIVQGFICENSHGLTDNFERGGSDFTATIIGKVINASEIQIWTDICGLHNNDPRVVDNTFTVKELTYKEASELAFFGAKILHPKCIVPAEEKNIPILIKNTFCPNEPGTSISSNADRSTIKAVAAKDGITAIKIQSARMFMTYGFLSKVFAVFEKYKTSIDMITTSEVSVSLSIDENSFISEIENELKQLGNVEITTDQTIVCIVGDFLAKKPGLSNMVLNAIKQIPLRMISYGGSENNMSVLINTSDKKETLESLQKGLFTENYDNVELEPLCKN